MTSANWVPIGQSGDRRNVLSTRPTNAPAVPALLPRRGLFQRAGVPLPLGERVERMGAVPFAGRNQTQEQIARQGPILTFIKQRILSVQNHLLPRALANVRIQWCATLTEKQR